MTYVETIEPRLTAPRAASPADAAEVLIEWCRDLEAEIGARLTLVTTDDLTWQPHPDSNSVGVTVWHALASYLSQSTALLIERIALLGAGLLKPGGQQLSAFHGIGSTLQGSFGHAGEIDTLVALRARLERR